jgi:predicted amidohydrolase YtcJ
MTPLWSVDDPWEMIFAPRLFGPERFRELYRTGTLLEAGVVLVWGSDWPVTGVSPLEGLETAITHRLFETPPLEIHSVPVDMTIVGGEVIFERSAR